MGASIVFSALLTSFTCFRFCESRSQFSFLSFTKTTVSFHDVHEIVFHKWMRQAFVLNSFFFLPNYQGWYDLSYLLSSSHINGLKWIRNRDEQNHIPFKFFSLCFLVQFLYFMKNRWIIELLTFLATFFFSFPFFLNVIQLFFPLSAWLFSNPLSSIPSIPSFSLSFFFLLALLIPYTISPFLLGR